MKKMLRMIITGISLVFCLYCTPTHAQAIVVDGHLDETAWDSAKALPEFVAVQPYTLTTPEYPTQAWLYTDHSGLYIAVHSQQPRQTQLSELSARDSRIRADKITLIIDFDNTDLTAYSFELSNGGAIRDGVWRDENQFSDDWDGIWYAGTTQTEQAWTAEIHIPWEIAPMPETGGSTRNVGLYVARFVAHRGDIYANAPTVSTRQSFISTFPSVEIPTYDNASLRAFVYLSAQRDRLANDTNTAAGMDLFWNFGAGRQLDATINPDFGQVESDNLVVNFTPLETFFSEKRPFFTQNHALFDLRGTEGLRLFHTRRIGGRPDTGSRSASDIKTALRFTSTGEALSYGVFAAIEDNHTNHQGKSFYAARAVHSNDTYSIGFLSTYVDRPDLERQAQVHALDWRYDWSSGVEIKGQLVRSAVDTPERESSGEAAWLQVAQQIHDNWSQRLSVTHYADDLQVNDLGFLPRADLRAVSYNNTWKNPDFDTHDFIKEHEMRLDADYQANTDHELLEARIRFLDIWRFNNSSRLNWYAEYFANANDDLITRGGNSLKTEAGYTLSITYHSPETAQFRYHGYVDWIDRFDQGKGFGLHWHPSYHFSPQVSVNWSLFYTDTDNWLTWRFGNELGAYSRQLMTNAIDFNINFSEKQELRLKFEWLALSAKGQSAHTVASDGELLPSSAPINDFSVSDTALQLRYRYQIAPLSNLYLVYSRGGNIVNDEHDSLLNLFDSAWDKRNGDNLFVKLRYQFK